MDQIQAFNLQAKSTFFSVSALHQLLTIRPDRDEKKGLLVQAKTPSKAYETFQGDRDEQQTQDISAGPVEYPAPPCRYQIRNQSLISSTIVWHVPSSSWQLLLPLLEGRVHWLPACLCYLLCIKREGNFPIAFPTAVTSSIEYWFTDLQVQISCTA